MDGNFQLIAHLEDLIADHGPIPFSEYMETVLYHPEHGYYCRELNPIGSRGDFYTASSLDPAMGQLLAGLFERMEAHIPDFALVELGAGTGLLARQILETRPFPYVIVERSLPMRERQREMLQDFDIEWRDDLPEDIRGCVFSNEFFDALPVRRFTLKNNRLREYFVAEGLVETEGDPSVPVDLPLLAEGAVADISLDAREWVGRIGRSIDVGYHLAIDYGYLERELFRRTSGTLMCYLDHQVDENPYAHVGLKDITAHVDFSDLIEFGGRGGLKTRGFCSQREFLVDLGLLDLIAALIERGDPASIGRVQALKTLLLPPMMGDRFKVLLQRKGILEGDLGCFRDGGV